MAKAPETITINAALTVSTKLLEEADREAVAKIVGQAVYDVAYKKVIDYDPSQL